MHAVLFLSHFGARANATVVVKIDPKSTPSNLTHEAAPSCIIIHQTKPGPSSLFHHVKGHHDLSTQTRPEIQGWSKNTPTLGHYKIHATSLTLSSFPCPLRWWYNIWTPTKKDQDHLQNVSRTIIRFSILRPGLAAQVEIYFSKWTKTVDYIIVENKTHLNSVNTVIPWNNSMLSTGSCCCNTMEQFHAIYWRTLCKCQPSNTMECYVIADITTPWYWQVSSSLYSAALSRKIK